MSLATGVLNGIPRIAAAGHVVVGAPDPGVALLIGTLGVVDRVAYVDTGEVDVFFRLSNGFTAARPPILMLTILGNAFGQISGTYLPPGLPPAPQVIQGIRVFTADNAGSALDQDFMFAVLVPERFGGQPLPAPGT